MGLRAFLALASVVTISPPEVLARALDPVALTASMARQSKSAPARAIPTRPPGTNPFLGLLPAEAAPDYGAWRRWLRHESRQKLRAQLPHLPTGLVVGFDSEPNDTQATASFIGNFGTGDDPEAEVTGSLTAASAAPAGPFAEDDSAIPLASATGLASGTAIVVSGIVGDGPHGAAGSGTGDFDFFEITGVATGDTIVLDVDTPAPFGALDPVVSIWDAGGALLATNDDDGLSFDSFLVFTAPAPGVYYAAIGGFGSPVPADPFDPASGSGAGSEGIYDFSIALSAGDAIDFFSFDLEPGDVIAANVSGTGSHLTLFDPLAGERIGSAQEFSAIHPGPFPGGGNASFVYVVESAGTHAVRVSGPPGAYTLDLRAFRPALERGESGMAQTLFVDFDGAVIDPSIFGAAPGSAALSPLASFLARWGLTPADEDAVTDAILAVIAENLSTDMRVLAANGDFDASGIAGEFDIVILNSRDHADPFGQPGVSRVIIGGTIAELGIATLGIAESIDVGNFSSEETAVVLLDYLSLPASNPNSLNQFGLAGGATIVDLIGLGVGNIAAHEAGHFFASFHTDQFNPSPNIMDQGGNLPNLVGVGGDLTLGTGDDVDVDFGPDDYVPNEGFTGLEDTLNATAFGLSTGTTGCAMAPTGACRTPGKSLLLIKDGTPDRRDRIVFRWLQGATTTQAELGDPLASDDYRICVYDASGRIRSNTAPAGGTCADADCWQELGPADEPRGFRYRDKELTPDGTQNVSLRSGAAPRPRVIWKARGEGLDDGALGLTPPVTVEVINGETGICFGETYDASRVIKNTPELFRARSR
jgi:hypothetical protein